MRPWSPIPLIALVVMACQANPGPGDTLRGTWASTDARLIATDQGLQFATRCQAATFGPVVLDANGKFHARSITFDQSGNVKPTPGASVEIDGTLAEGKAVSLQLVYRSPTGSPSDPVPIWLIQGDPNVPLVCNA